MAAAASSTLSMLNLRKPRSSRIPPHRPSSAALLRPAATLREAESTASLAIPWRKVQGADNWTGLVEPLSPLLRDVLVQYGELAMACYKAFDLDPASPTHLRCKYRKPRLMAEVGLGAAGYEVTKYVYATPPDVGLPLHRRARWIGYIAVSSDAARRRLGRRDVLVAFRGTATGAEWAANLMSSLAPADLDHARGPPRRGVKVESGFLGLYTAAGSGRSSCREQLLGEVRRLVREHKGEEMSITLAGHSMGSALALLLGYDLAELGVNGTADQVPVTVYSFGGPRVGNGAFKERCEELGVNVLRVANVHDPVTKLPGLFMNERRPWPRLSSSCYAHVGVELAVECSGTRNPIRVHDLETYLGLLRSPKMVEVEEEMRREEEEELQAWPWQVRHLVQSLGLTNLNI